MATSENAKQKKGATAKKGTGDAKGPAARKAPATKKTTAPKAATNKANTKSPSSNTPSGPKRSSSAATAKKARAGSGGTSSSPAAERTRRRTGGKPNFDAIRESGYWERSRERAKKLLGDREKLEELVDEANRKPTGGKRGKLSEMLDELRALLRLVRAYASGEYREVSWENMLLIVAAIAYFVSPVDLIPDPLPGVGYADDAVVLAWTIRMVRDEIDAFLKWESAQ